MGELTGGRVNYYLAKVDHPQREEQAPYQAECEDIIAALKMDFNQACEFKAIWRTASAALGKAKQGHKALYDAQKRVHYATRSLVELQREANADDVPEPTTTDLAELVKHEIARVSVGSWVAHTGDMCPLDPNTLVQVRLDNGHEVAVPRKAGEWNWDTPAQQRANLAYIDAWRFA